MTIEALQEVARNQHMSHTDRTKDELVQMFELNDIALGGNAAPDHAQEVQGSNIPMSTITGYPMYGASDAEHLRTEATSRGLCAEGGMALLIRVLEMNDAMKSRNLDSQAGPYTSGSGYIFSSTTGKVLYHNMSETELRSKCISLQLPYMGLSKDTMAQNLELHDIPLQSDADEGAQEANALTDCALCMTDYGPEQITIPPCCFQGGCTACFQTILNDEQHRARNCPFCRRGWRNVHNNIMVDPIMDHDEPNDDY